jgi:hypothetical protein
VGALSGPPSGPGISRRRLLAGVLLLPPALAGCSLAGPAGPTGPDPLIALADAARADAALAIAAIAASPSLTGRVQPLIDARTAHAAALDAEVARLDPDHDGPTPIPTAAPVRQDPDLASVQEAVAASGRAAGEAAMTLPAERAGLVASVSACCTTYAATLQEELG